VAQGVAEVVPVSSSAQLVLLPWLLGWEQPPDRTAFGAALHAGSCLGIAWSLREDLRRLTLSEVLLLGACSVPAAVAGAVAAEAVEQRLGRPPQLAGLLAAAGALMWWADARAAAHDAGRAVTVRSDRPGAAGAPSGRCGRTVTAHGHRRVVTVAPGQAALAGLAQVAALVPGVSRSGAALTALRVAGVDRDAAERFSLLMSLPITAGAAGLTLARSRGAGARDAAPGVVTAALAGSLAARHRAARPGRPLRGAALYRLGLAAVVARRLHHEGAEVAQ
jgi:undecaprenyl-diphosphatase